jgi:hypothetical protein
MKKLLKCLYDIIFHFRDKSYKIFGEYRRFTGTILFRNGTSLDIKNVEEMHFHGDFIIFVSERHSICNGIQITYRRLTINCNEIERIFN